MNDQPVQFADYFPELKYKPTKVPYIFKTEWVKNRDRTQKRCTFFAAPVLGTAYGVDVIKPWAGESKQAELEAIAKVQEAMVYYEEHKTWPPTN